jgi:phosphoserine phosphatase RsbU/P
MKRVPAPTEFPTFEGAELAASYIGARMGGDFFDVVLSPTGRVVFVMLDIAGARDEALDIAANVQDVFRALVPKLFSDDDANEADAVTELGIEINRTILERANGARCAPAFLASYAPSIGTITCINAGHMPGFVVDNNDIIMLASNGVPLGLFSHAIHDAQICALLEGDAFVLASRGVAESHAKMNDFGIDGIRLTLTKLTRGSAKALCQALLDMAKTFSGDRAPENDMTVLALLRAAKKREPVVIRKAAVESR